MSLEVRTFTLTVPAGTPQTAPFALDCTMPPRTVESISWKVPPGPRGTMGWQIQNSGLRVLPTAPEQWIVTDNESDVWVLVNAITSGSWQVAGYNTGANPHSVYFRFNVSLPPVPGQGGITPLIPSTLIS